MEIGDRRQEKRHDQRGDNAGNDQVRHVKPGVAGVDLLGLG